MAEWKDNFAASKFWNHNLAGKLSRVADHLCLHLFGLPAPRPVRRVRRFGGLPVVSLRLALAKKLGLPPNRDADTLDNVS